MTSLLGTTHKRWSLNISTSVQRISHWLALHASHKCTRLVCRPNPSNASRSCTEYFTISHKLSMEYVFIQRLVVSPTSCTPISNFRFNLSYTVALPKEMFFFRIFSKWVIVLPVHHHELQVQFCDTSVIYALCFRTH